MAGAAGGGETPTNAELVFSATCSTVCVRGQASATADVHQGVSAFHESSHAFSIHIPQSMFLFPFFPF